MPAPVIESPRTRNKNVASRLRTKWSLRSMRLWLWSAAGDGNPARTVALKNASGWGAPGADKAAKARAFRGWGLGSPARIPTGARAVGIGAGEGAKAKGDGADMPT